MPRVRIELALVLAVTGGLSLGCPGNGDCSASGAAGNVGGPVTGLTDRHCWSPVATGGSVFTPQSVRYPACYLFDGGPDFDEDAGHQIGSDYGPILWNTSGDDDDCKYVVSWTTTPVVVGEPITLWVTVQFATDGTPVTGMMANLDGGTGKIYLEAAGAPDGSIGMHISPTISGIDVPIVESPAGSGVYKFGPAIFFDVPGLWYMRFHFNENCDDILSTSPHGHAAFYVNVP